MTYEPTWESVKLHTVPEWFHDAKLGIFIHWGLYSVPAWAPTTGEMGKVIAEEGWGAFFARNPYSEWYLNSVRIPGSPTQRHHIETYGEGYSYDRFADTFNHAVEAWDPAVWARLFHRVGARYVVLTTKHHDGFRSGPAGSPTLQGRVSRQTGSGGRVDDCSPSRGDADGTLLFWGPGLDVQ